MYKLLEILQQATVYISVLGDEKQRENTLIGLAKAKGFIRSEIGQRIRLRKTPEIMFEFDESIDYGNQIETLLHQIHNEDKEKQQEDKITVNYDVGYDSLLIIT